MPDRHTDFERYRKLHPRFIFEGYSYSIEKEKINIEFHFQMESKSGASIFFSPKLSLALNASGSYSSSLSDIDNFVFHMGMVELISYWKAACPTEVIIKPYKLSAEQIAFWKKLYWNGLGEFFYVNKIKTDESLFMHIVSESEKELAPIKTKYSKNILVPVGGGKDSVVSLEILKESNVQLLPFIINPRQASLDSVKNAGLSKNLLSASRTIDPTLLRLNKERYLNGHTPFSAMLAFTSLLQAHLSNAGFIALSNESSANEASVANSHVNHQYSKSFEFESDFRAYYKKYISTELEYFSFLRPLSELQIACLFSKYKNHHFSFRSCNVGSKTDSWCCNCPKCLFTYIILSPFIKQQELDKMLGENLLNKESLRPALEELRGLSETKPFECVGTIDEVNLALHKALTTNEYSAQILRKESLPQIAPNRFALEIKDWNVFHFVPPHLETILKQKLEKC